MGTLADLRAWVLQRLGSEVSDREQAQLSATTLAACAVISHRLRERNVAHALIGGLALGAHKLVRATQDVDFLIDGARENAVHELMSDLGFETVHRTENVSNYLLEHQRVDFIHANRQYSRRMLDRATDTEVYRLKLSVATVEDVIGLKLQARRNDPSRKQDTADIHRLIEYNLEQLDVEYLRTFFRLFDCEEELDELIGRGK